MLDRSAMQRLVNHPATLWGPLLILVLSLLALGLAPVGRAGLLPALVVTGLLCCACLGVVFWQRGISDSIVAEGRDRRRQAAILKLLDEMGPLADGDLSVRATVDESMTGALADAFNHAVSELQWLVGEVAGSAQAVRAAVSSTHKPMRSLVSGASVQSREVLRSSNYLGAMSSAMTELSLKAGETSRRSRTSRVAMQRCRESLSATHDEFEAISKEAALTERLTERLADNLRAIDVQSDAIRRVAERTDLLALNSTVRAAGGSNRTTTDYARMSDDVADLARTLESASREVSELTSIIREDADEILRAMTHTGQSLGTAVAELETLQSGVDDLSGSTGELDDLLGETADSAARQARVLGRVSGNMTVIDRISREGASGSAHIAATLDNLQKLADALEQSVAGFRLPPAPVTSPAQTSIPREVDA